MPRLRAPLLLLSLLAMFATGCGSKRSTTAPATNVTSRVVTVLLTDSLGAPIPGVTVFMADADGLSLLGGATNAQGLRSARLPVGAAVAAMSPLPGEPMGAALVAGGTFVVPGDTRPEADTIMVRLVARTGSFIRGVAHRASPATVHVNIRVLIPDYLVDIEGSTNVDGDYLIGRIPAGDWGMLFVDDAASQAGSLTVTVPATPDTVDAPLVTLAPLPPGQALRAGPAATLAKSRR